MTSTKLKTSAPVAWRFLRFVPFATLDAWGYAALFSEKKHAPLFPTVPLSELIAHRKGFIRIDDSQRYARCRVQLRAQGVVLRDEVPGSAIKTKQQQVCRAGDFLVAEIDAKLGGFGIVPPELDGAVVSSHYFLFDIHEARLSREYLALCLRTDYFQRQVQATGSTNYAAIRPYHVLGYNIPLPPLAEQKRLVAAHRAALTKAGAAEARASEREQQAAHFLETALGLQTQITKPKLTPAKLHFVRFATLERWGVADENERLKSSYPLAELGSLLALVQYGLSEKATKEPTTQPLIRMNNVVDGELVLNDLKYLHGDPKSYSDYLLRNGDILFNRTNSKELVGKTAVFNVEGTYLFASYLIRLRLKSESADPAFINDVFNSQFCRTQIDSISRQALGQANINSKELRKFLFPLPPLAEQRRIVERLESLRAEARAARAEAESQRATAKQSFETALFG